MGQAASVSRMRSKRYSRVSPTRTAVRFSWILITPLLVVGCATPPPVAVQTPAPVLIAAVSPTKFVEMPYAVRGYREAANPSVRHETHAIYRRTRVPVTASDELAIVSRTTYPPTSISPLPINAELAAEIATQKKVTEDLRALQASMVEAESRMQAQYALLVRQSSEALKVRQQLEEERERVRVASSAAGPATSERATTAKSTEAKW